MKRIIALLLSVVMLCSLAACTARQDGQTAKQAKDYSQVYAAIKKQYDNANATLRNDGVFYAADAQSTADAAVKEESSEYSGTNVQVEGVDEGDIVKTDGEYIYALSSGDIVIYKADGENSRKIGSIAASGENRWVSEMYICNNVLVLVKNEGGNIFICEDRAAADTEAETDKTIAEFYDVSDPSAPVLKGTVGQDGWLLTSRLYDGKLYLISTYTVWNEPDEDDPQTYVPSYYRNGKSSLADCDCISIAPGMNGASYVVASCYDVKSGEQTAQRSVLGAGTQLYMNESSLYLASSRYEETCSNERKEDMYTVKDHAVEQFTDITRINASDLTVAATGTVKGLLESQFSMDEYEGNLRLVTTREPERYTVYTDEKRGFENWEWPEDGEKSSNGLYILDGNLKQLAAVEGLAEDERVYSVRFDGDFVYFCTFRQVDPLFAVNVSDPNNPKILSQLKISGFSEYLHPWSDTRLFGLGNEADENSGAAEGLKLVMFDISDKANVTAKHTLNLGDSYSEALYNHKAILISPEKNLIAFGTDNKYLVFSYSDEGGFKQQASIDLGEDWCSSRGLYIGDCAYIVSDLGMKVLSMQSFEMICTAEL